MWPDWRGETCVIVASGPSAADVLLEIGKGKVRFLAVKDGWRLAPWADALYGADFHWWEQHGGVTAFRGLCIAGDWRAAVKFGGGREFRTVEFGKLRQEMQFGRPGVVGWGGNSGFHAINLAAQWGSKRLLLVGFDMRVDRGKHFFGDHHYTKDRPAAKNVALWAKILDRQAGALAARGVEIVNCSPVSALKAFPKMTLEAALDACGSVPEGFRLEAGPGCHHSLSGGDADAGHDTMRGGCDSAGTCGTCQQATAEA